MLLDHPVEGAVHLVTIGRLYDDSVVELVLAAGGEASYRVSAEDGSAVVFADRNQLRAYLMHYLSTE